MQQWLQDKNNEMFSVEDVNFCQHLFERKLQNGNTWIFYLYELYDMIKLVFPMALMTY